MTRIVHASIFLSASLTLVSLWASPSGFACASAADRPHIVIILADDMGFSDIGCYGGEIRTSNLDRLAKNGLRFTQFYNTARCCPTRASLLTGLYPHQAGVGWMMSDDGHDGYRGDLNRRSITIAEAVKLAGYSTYMSGKWHVTRHVGAEAPKHNWPRQRGFDRFFGTIHGAGSFYDPNSLTLDNEPVLPGKDFYYTDAISDHAVQFIREHAEARGEQPFFLYVAYTAPHWPMHALPEDIERYRGRYAEGWDALRKERHARMIEMGIVEGEWPLTARDDDAPAWEDAEDKPWFERRMEVYAAMIDRMDQGIGRIVDALRERGFLDDTLILFLADNGGCAEEYGSTGAISPPLDAEGELAPIAPDEIQTRMQPLVTRDGRPVRTGRGVMPGPADTYIAYGKPWANASNTPFRLYKHWVHEGGISTPLIAHWPKFITRRGELEHQPGHLIDLMATCVALAGVEYPATYRGEAIQRLEGRSLLPAFRGETIEREALYWEHEGNRAVRRGDWKLVARGANGPWELYDLAADRTELHDLAAEKPEQTRELSALWEAYARRTGVYPLVPWRKDREASFSKETRFRLAKGADLSRSEAPHVVGKAFSISARVDTTARDGVIVAQGGSSQGYALYLEDGIVYFALRRNGDLTAIASDGPPGRSPFTVVARVGRDGALALAVGGEDVASGQAEGALAAMPIDGLQVGEDRAGAVGEYAAPNALDAASIDVTIELESP